MQLNPQLADLPVYHPGRPLEEVARELDLPLGELIKLASNENPLGPSPKAIKAMQETVRCLTIKQLFDDLYARFCVCCRGESGQRDV